jgi:hypothetical protein
MFLAYDRIPYNQHTLYQQYAELTPGADTRFLAQDIAGKAQTSDQTVKDFNEALRWTLIRHNKVPVEFFLFTIRSSDGDTFDMYLMDEDSLFVGVIVNIAEADVLTTGQTMLDAVSFKTNRAVMTL